MKPTRNPSRMPRRISSATGWSGYSLSLLPRIQLQRSHNLAQRLWESWPWALLQSLHLSRDRGQVNTCAANRRQLIPPVRAYNYTKPVGVVTQLCPMPCTISQLARLTTLFPLPVAVRALSLGNLQLINMTSSVSVRYALLCSMINVLFLGRCSAFPLHLGWPWLAPAS